MFLSHTSSSVDESDIGDDEIPFANIAAADGDSVTADYGVGGFGGFDPAAADVGSTAGPSNAAATSTTDTSP